MRLWTSFVHTTPPCRCSWAKCMNSQRLSLAKRARRKQVLSLTQTWLSRKKMVWFWTECCCCTVSKNYLLTISSLPNMNKKRIPVDYYFAFLQIIQVVDWPSVLSQNTVWLYNIPLSYFMSWLWQIGIVPCGRRTAGLCRRGRHGKEASVHGQWGRPGGRPCSPEVHHAQVSVNVTSGLTWSITFYFI